MGLLIHIPLVLTRTFCHKWPFHLSAGDGDHNKASERGRRRGGSGEGALGGAADDHRGRRHHADADGRLQRPRRNHAGKDIPIQS